VLICSTYSRKIHMKNINNHISHIIGQEFLPNSPCDKEGVGLIILHGVKTFFSFMKIENNARGIVLHMGLSYIWANW
jgi:hypothetical protein